MKSGTHKTAKTRHTLFDLFRPDRVRDKDNREFLDMFKSSQYTIFHICLFFTDRQPDNIRDLYQDIALALWESWPNFKGDCATDTWVRRISLNTAISNIRRRKRRPQFEPLEDWMYEAIADEASKAPPDYYHILSLLDPDDLSLLYLRLEQLSIKEIALATEISEAAVKQKLYRIRQKIDALKQKETTE